MRVLAGFVVMLWIGLCGAAEPKSSAIVSGKQGDRPLKLEGGLNTYYEGLVVALLGTCSVEGDATKEQWENALKGDHLRIQFPKPRTFAMNPEKKEVEVEEIVVPMSDTAMPKHIFVRNGTSYRAFAKYQPKICFFIQDELKSLRPAR